METEGMNPTTSEQDRELLELAAKSAGYALAGHDFLPEGAAWAHEIGAEPNYDGELPIFMWNPLHDDGDALRLAAQLGITIDFYDCCAWKRLPNHALIQEFWGGDYPDSYKHAIVRAAAAIAKGEK